MSMAIVDAFLCTTYSSSSKSFFIVSIESGESFSPFFSSS